MNDETKRTIRDLFGRIGEWLYDHSAETLAVLVATTAGAAFSLWVHLGALADRLDHVAEQQSVERLCQRTTACESFDEIEAMARHCDKDQMLCQERLLNLSNRVLETERRLNNLATAPAVRPDPFTGTMGRALEERIKALEEQP